MKEHSESATGSCNPNITWGKHHQNLTSSWFLRCPSPNFFLSIFVNKFWFILQTEGITETNAFDGVINCHKTVYSFTHLPILPWTDFSHIWCGDHVVDIINRDKLWGNIRLYIQGARFLFSPQESDVFYAVSRRRWPWNASWPGACSTYDIAAFYGCCVWRLISAVQLSTTTASFLLQQQRVAIRRQKYSPLTLHHQTNFLAEQFIRGGGGGELPLTLGDRPSLCLCVKDFSNVVCASTTHDTNSCKAYITPRFTR